MNPFKDAEFAKPGEELHFYKELKKRGLLSLPPTGTTSLTHGKVVTTPYLFSPVNAQDQDGHRPINDLQYYSEGIVLTEVNSGQRAGDRLKKNVLQP